ncbi:hypothetical protein D3C85_1682620 [compost metagenome]
MGWHVAGVVVQLPAQALAVHQQLVEFSGQGLLHVFAHVVLVGLAIEDALVELLLEPLGQGRPVGAYRLQALEDHFPAAVRTYHQPGIAFLAAFLGAADGRHQEALVVGLVL